MSYSISCAAKKFGVETHTLRYYEKEGIVVPGRTAGGIRMYDDEDMARLEMVMCLKSTGMPIKDIKKYFEMVTLGDETLDERLDIFEQHRAHVMDEIETLKRYLVKIEGKIKWYTAFVEEKRRDKRAG